MSLLSLRHANPSVGSSLADLGAHPDPRLEAKPEVWSHALGSCSGAISGPHCESRKRNRAPAEEERDEGQREEEDREEEEEVEEMPGRLSPGLSLQEQREVSSATESSYPAQQ